MSLRRCQISLTSSWAVFTGRCACRTALARRRGRDMLGMGDRCGDAVTESEASQAAIFSCTVTLPCGRSPPKMVLDRLEAERAGAKPGRPDR